MDNERICSDAGGSSCRLALVAFCRGMDFLTDARDWLGGYPYEWASAEEVIDFFAGLTPTMQVVRVKHEAIAGFLAVRAEDTVLWLHNGALAGHWWGHTLVPIPPDEARPSKRQGLRASLRYLVRAHALSLGSSIRGVARGRNPSADSLDTLEIPDTPQVAPLGSREVSLVARDGGCLKGDGVPRSGWGSACKDARQRPATSAHI